MKDGAAQLPTNPVEVLRYRKPNDEEMKVYNDCISGSYFRAGLPFAVISYFVSQSLKKPGASGAVPKSFAKNCLIFTANSILGSFLYLPVCYARFSSVYMNNLKKEQEGEAAGDVLSTQLTEGTLPQTIVEDFSYPIDAVTQLNESEGSFSSDFSYSRLLEDDSDRFSAKSQTTTYGDLRARHRNEQTKPTKTPGSSLNVEKAPSTFSTPFSKEEETREPAISSRPVRKNIYGDEME